MKLLSCFLSLFLLTCNGDSIGDCFQSKGALTSQEVVVPFFENIHVNRDIEVILKEGSSQKVEIVSGKNLIGDIEATVSNKTLTLTNNSSCLLGRHYDIKVYITAPHIETIESSTQYDIRSEGVLTYPRLRLVSENSENTENIASGNFRLQVDSKRVYLEFNSTSSAFITGKTGFLEISFFSGTSRFEGRDLVAQFAYVTSRSSNDVIVNPQQSIRARILGTGDVIAANKPPSVILEKLYTGTLIFE